MAITVNKERITPPLASEWLDKYNTCNRCLSRRRVELLVKAIRNGEWEDNTETIKWNGDKQLIDGQHRLTAIRESGTTLTLWVARGLSEKAYDTIDQGQARRMRDVFSRNGEVYYSELATAIRWLNINKNGSGSQLTNPQGVEVLKQNPELKNSVHYICEDCNAKNFRIISAGMASALHYLMAKKNKLRSDKFWLQVYSGEKLTRKSAAWKLRDLLIKNKIASEKLQRMRIYSLIIKAWNSYQTGSNFTSKLLKEDMIAEIK